MNINVEETKALFKEYSNIITNYSLPTWDSFPTIDLYMDQVITLLEQYMAFAGDEKIITQSMINNYVKLGIMPPPINKKYSRVHLAYLVIICILKQTLSMGTIQKIIPCTLTPEEVGKTYNLFIQNQSKAFSYVIDSIKRVADPVLEDDDISRLDDLLIQLSIASNICKIFTDKIVNH